MTRRPVMVIVAVVAVVGLMCGGMVVLPLVMFGLAAAEAAACEVSSAPGAPVSGTGSWDGTQTAHAATIVAAGAKREVHARGYVIALATAMQESALRNLANANVPESLSLPHEGVGRDHDSVGLFQQRPGWGSVRERMTPSYAADKFYEALAGVEGWQQMRLTDAAQAVQRSAYPEAYQKWEDDAEQLAAHVLGLASIDDIGGGAPIAPCGVDDFGPVPVGPGGWVQPVTAPVNSGFGPRGGAFHAGADMSRRGIRGEPIRAAAAGVVEQVKCNWYTTCDRDGHTGSRGCGWYIDIRHAGDIVTRYCHLIRRPEVPVGATVAAGQVIGLVGNSGGSSGPHLHFEVHVNVPAGPHNATRGNAVDPVPFMRAQGAPLGQGT